MLIKLKETIENVGYKVKSIRKITKQKKLVLVIKLEKPSPKAMGEGFVVLGKINIVFI